MAKESGQATPPKGTSDAPTEKEDFVITELKGVIEQQKGLIEVLSNQLDVMGKALTSRPSGPEDAPKTTMEIIQINAGGRKYFCKTPEEQVIFKKNHPGLTTETFTHEMPIHIAKGCLNQPQNKGQFEEQSPIRRSVEGSTE